MLKVLLKLQMNMCSAMRIECEIAEELGRKRERKGGRKVEKERYIVARACIESAASE